MESLNWGIIGPGNIAHDFARDLELVRPDQHIRAVLGRTRETADNFSRQFGVKDVFTDIGTFVKHPDINIAYIATPHPQHFEQALACLENKIHVLCEKPMTLNASQAAELVAASEKNNCFLMEAMWVRFLPSFQKLLSLLKEGSIGEIISIKASMGYKAPKDGGNRYFNPELGGGSLLDLGVYPVFLAHLLLGKPAVIKAVGALTEKGVDKSCAVLFGYPGGQYAMLDSSLVSHALRPAEITGEKGIIRILNPWFEKSIGIELAIYDKESVVYPCEWEGHGLQFETMETLLCVHNRQIESALFSHSFSRQISETMDEIRRQLGVVYNEYE